MDTPVSNDSDGNAKTIGDMIESEEYVDDCAATDNAISLIQSYINRNKVIEAIILDNIAFNDVQKHFKKVIKTTNPDGETVRYTDHSSEFWPYKLVQIVSKLPETYKESFLTKYTISEEKLTTVLEALGSVTNQKLYKYLKATIEDLKVSFIY
jgi:hypothetical protein